MKQSRETEKGQYAWGWRWSQAVQELRWQVLSGAAMDVDRQDLFCEVDF